MLTEGRWIVPTIAGDTYAEKPPLQVWCIIASAKLRGTDVDPFDARVPSALGGLLTIAATYWLARRAGGPAFALVAALVAASTIEFFLRARWCQVDALFTGCYAFAFLFAIDAARGPTLRNLAGLAVALGAATLTKGPLAGALLTAALAANAAANPALTALRRPRALLAIGAALAAAACIALPWYLALAAQDPQGLWRALIHENVKRFASSQDHARPFHYYLSSALWGSLAPCSLLLPPAAAFAWRTTSREGAKPLHTRDAAIVRACWLAFAAGLILLSAASSKQGKYLLPLLPAFAIGITDFARGVVEHGRPWERAWTTAVLSVIALLSVIAMLFTTAASFFGARADDALLSLISIFTEAPALPVPIRDVLPALTFLGFGGFALLAVGMHTRASFRLAWLAATLCIAEACIAAQLFPEVNDGKSAKPVVAAAMRRLDELERGGKSPRYVVWRVDRTSQKSVDSWTDSSPFVYYAEGKWRKPEVVAGAVALEAELRNDARPIVMVLRATHFDAMPPELRARFLPRFQASVGSRTLVVVETGA